MRCRQSVTFTKYVLKIRASAGGSIAKVFATVECGALNPRAGRFGRSPVGIVH